MTFFAVMGKNAPAFTVASFTISMTSRPCTRARPVTTPAGRRAAPLFIHAPRHVRAQLEELGARIDQQRNALARGQAALLVLRLDGLLAAALLDDLFFIADLGDQVGHGLLVALEAGGVGLHLGFEGRSGMLAMVSHRITKQTIHDKAGERPGAM